MDLEYVTGKINSHILELLLRQFCCLIFAPSQNLNMLWPDKVFFQQLQKIFQPFTSVDIASSGSYKRFSTINVFV